MRDGWNVLLVNRGSVSRYPEGGALGRKPGIGLERFAKLFEGLIEVDIAESSLSAELANLFKRSSRSKDLDRSAMSKVDWL